MRDSRFPHGGKNRTAIFFLLLLVIIIPLLIIKFLLINKNWNGKSRLTVVLFSNSQSESSSTKVAFFSYDPVLRQLRYAHLPANTYLDVPYGYQSYNGAIVYNLGELDKKHGGGKLLSRSIENTFGLAVDRYFVYQQGILDNLPAERTALLSFKQNYFTLNDIYKSALILFTPYPRVDSNLSFWDKIKLWNAVRKLRSDQLVFMDLESMKVLEERKLPDQSISKILNKDLLDNLFIDKFLDTKIRAESLSIEIINATGEEKIASHFSRIITNLGGKVIIKSTANETEKFSCRLKISQDIQKRSNLVRKLRQLYDCSVMYNNQMTEQSDVKIILGKGFVE